MLSVVFFSDRSEYERLMGLVGSGIFLRDGRLFACMVVMPQLIFFFAF